MDGIPAPKKSQWPRQAKTASLCEPRTQNVQLRRFQAVRRRCTSKWQVFCIPLV
ncbi:hypothetical protein ACPOL_3904 [Acidisarcina polymorpha]|uniref:Uncharacterized protein n=1 Tax=Acidisarcina polymorpha TaxID=2211140 RepID=A0A2Z5G1Y6_9BACT|nr:hypothetical protein ACPOL_3904 [Acidisarcina polymorpha]